MTPDKNNYVFSIKGLLISKKSDINKIAEDIDKFITLAPGISEKLLENLFANRMAYFISNIEICTSMLQDVRARWLATDADYLLRAAKKGDVDVCRNQITQFISNLFSLSIEMQLAQTRASGDSTDGNQSKIEAYTDMVNHLSAIERLLANDEHKRAYKMLADMEGLEENPVAAGLMAALEDGDSEKADKLTRALKDGYIKLIVNHSGDVSDFHRKILAVDDQPSMISMVTNSLKDRYKVLGAPSGRVALKILVSETPELFILDIDMPDMDGYELAKAIRAKDNFVKTPILFLTGNATREHVVKALGAGGNDFIVKPASQITLLAKVGKYLS